MEKGQSTLPQPEFDCAVIQGVNDRSSTRNVKINRINNSLHLRYHNTPIFGTLTVFIQICLDTGVIPDPPSGGSVRMLNRFQSLIGIVLLKMCWGALAPTV